MYREEDTDSSSTGIGVWNDFFSDKPADKLQVFDWSVSGFETCVVVKGQGFRLALDMGACPSQAVSADVVFVSHGHIDHCGALHMHMRRRQLLKLAPATYYVPEHLVEQLQEIVRLFNAVHGDDGGESGSSGGEGFHGKIVAALPNAEIELSKNLKLRPFATDHRVPSIGCVVLRRRSHLLPEFADRDSRELGELAKSGVTIRESCWEPMLAYTGDTRFSVLAGPPDPDLLQVQLLICELTYLDGPTDKADQFCHCHVHDFSSCPANLFDRVGCLFFVHFSRRYSPDQVLKVIHSSLPHSLKSKVFCGLNALRFYQSPEFRKS